TRLRGRRRHRDAVQGVHGTDPFRRGAVAANEDGRAGAANKDGRAGAANGYGRAGAATTGIGSPHEDGRAAAVPEAGRPTRPVPSPAPRRGLPPRTVRPPAGTPRRAPRTHPRPRAVVGAPVGGTRSVMQHTGAPGPAHDHSASVY